MSYNLYRGVPPHERGNQTSLAAALSVLPFAATWQERVYRFVAECGASGATDDEIEAALDMPHQTASARRRELVQLGRIADAGFTRFTRHRRRAKVHVVAGLEAK